MRKKIKKAVKDKIESQKVLSETARRSYELLRLTRIKYSNSPYSFIDLRLFQRGMDDSGEDAYFPTRKGVQIKEELFQRLIGKFTLSPSLLFHPILLKKAYPAFQREDFDTAVFLAFKAVEVRVRELSYLPMDLVGIGLMRKAFDVDSGILSNKKIPKAEREALSHLFAGAIGSYKNPHSHRNVELSFRESLGMLLVASHLLNTLDCLKPTPSK